MYLYVQYYTTPITEYFSIFFAIKIFKNILYIQKVIRSDVIRSVFLYVQIYTFWRTVGIGNRCCRLQHGFKVAAVAYIVNLESLQTSQHPALKFCFLLSDPFYLVLNLSVSQPIWFIVYMIPNLSVPEPVWSRICLIQNLSDPEPL
jgi:hypothetical protein